MLKTIFLCGLLFFLQGSLSATTVSGKIVDKQGEELPFVSIYIKNTSKSTTANVNGKFNLELVPGDYVIIFRMVGYKSHTEEVHVGTEKIELNITLESEVYVFTPIEINSDAEDPAYAVIRAAIKKRKFYLEQVNSFGCDVYIKGLQRVTKFPKKIMGMQVDPEGDIDTVSGIVYLSESVSKFWFKQPDKIREEMISSKVSGNNRAFSYNRASDMMFNFYENIIEVNELSERGFISPINNNALYYYKYKLHGTFQENGEMINKIEVIPRRRTDPCFHGFIYITENTWRIHSTELILTKDAQIDFVDTLLIQQVHFPVDKDVWMILSNKFIFSFGILGIKGNGTFVGVNSNYLLDPELPKRFFGAEEWKVEEDANKKDTAYWKTTRPIPLTSEEEKDYRKRDSLEIIRNSKPYLDSVDKVTNRLTLGKLLFTGYTYNQRYKKRTWEFSPLIFNVSFNTVQGLVTGINIERTQQLEKNRRYNVSVEGSYGFTDERVNASAHFNYLYKPQRFARWRAAGGMRTLQLNEINPIGPFLNTMYTLLDEHNYGKYYQKVYGSIEHDIEIVNGIYLRTELEYADRKPLYNNSFYSWIDVKDRSFTSNNPELPFNENVAPFSSHQSFTANAVLRLRIKQKYYTRPNRKIITGSKFPTFVLNYQKAIPGVIGSDADYDLLKISMHDEIKLKMLGSTTYMITWGKFLSAKNVIFPDLHHFNGNQTLFSNFTLTKFNLLQYYTYSSTDEYVEAHLEHRFGGFITNKLPLIRKLKLSDIAGVHFLTTSALPQYLEVFFGLEKLGVVRIDFVTGFSSSGKVSSGFRFGIFVD